ncbi:N-acetyltransferase domain-containing protein [Durusdinium trenchii]|uniref:N-acetyltransferase domain-containing protein n=1 Tax=Durusdinium trenchii TaxID=1381693 RepID=A0ABP0QTX4_9DINO
MTKNEELPPRSQAELWAKDVLRVPEATTQEDVILLVSSKNLPAQRLYERMGYELVLKDPWALRAVPEDEGQIQRIRVTNLGYRRSLAEAREGLVKATPWRTTVKNGRRTKQTEVSYDLDGDYIVAVEQGAVGHSGSLGVQLLFFTAKGQVLTVAGRKHEAPPSRVRFEVHPAEQVVGLEVEFGRIVGIQSALIPVDSDLEVNS